MPKLAKLSIPLVAVMALAGACGNDTEGSDAAQAQSVTVEAYDNYYEQTSIALEPGAEATVTLENVGGVAHSITINDLDVEIEAQSGESAESTFGVPNEPGSLDFYCKFHPDEMTGVITIGGADQDIEEDVDDPDDDDVDVDVDVEEEDDTDAGASTDEVDY